MMAMAGLTAPTVVVIGAGEVGSAVAVSLHRAGCAVVLCDRADPAWPRRGMCFANAWYIGHAELDGEPAIFCASLRSVPAVVERHRAIAATTWSWAGVAAALAPSAIVDATMRHGSLASPRDILSVAVRARPGAAASADVVVDAGGDSTRGGFAGNVVHAPRGGRFATVRRIADPVLGGEIVGAVGPLPIAAPCDGLLLGLSARGARVDEGAPVVEVDDRGDPALCFGIDERDAATARAVVRVLAERGIVPDAPGRLADPASAPPPWRV